MNVWLMMWLYDGKVNQASKEQVVLLHTDGIRDRHKFRGDRMNPFFETYIRNFKGVITANSLGNATLCAEKIIFQPNGATHSCSHVHTYSLTHSLTHLLTYLLTYSLTHLLTYLLTYSLTHSLTHSLTISTKIFCMGLVDN